MVDRGPEPASETSFGNAGMIAPGHAYAWSSPQAFRTLARALWRDDLALRFRFQADPQFWRWCWKFARQCTTERAAYNTGRKVALCLYSQRQLHRVVADTGVAYGARQGGALYLHRDPAALARAAATAQILRDQGVEIRAVDPDEAAAIDPVYAPVRDRFAGALYAPGDESGDARLFTLRPRRLARRARRRAAPRPHRSSGIDAASGRVTAVRTDQGAVDADAYVLALGCYSAPVGRTIGLDLPIYPIKGYSVTLPIEGRNNPPTLTGRRRAQPVRLRQLWRPGADDRHRRVRRLRPVAPAGRLRAHAAGGARAVPGRRQL